MDQEKFDLDRFKQVSGGGCEVEWEQEFIEDTETYYDKMWLKTAKMIHPDLAKVLEQLKPMFSKAHDYSFIRDLILKPEFGASADQAQIAEKTYQEILKKVNITGISLSGKGDKRGVVITATYTTASNKKIGMATELIKLNFQQYGFEEELEKLVEELTSEVYHFVFDNKRAKVVMGDLFSGYAPAESTGLKDPNEITEVDFEDNTQAQPAETKDSKKTKKK